MINFTRILLVLITIFMIYIGDISSIVYPLFILFWFTILKAILKANKQRPDETDEEYAERKKRIQEVARKNARNDQFSQNTSGGTISDPKYNYLPYNIYYPFKNDK